MIKTLIELPKSFLSMKGLFEFLNIFQNAKGKMLVPHTRVLKYEFKDL